MKKINIFLCSPFPNYSGGIESWLYQFIKKNEGAKKYSITVYSLTPKEHSSPPVFNTDQLKYCNVVQLTHYNGFKDIVPWCIRFIQTFKKVNSNRNGTNLVLNTVPILLPVIIMKLFRVLKGKVICSVRGQIAQDAIDLNKPYFYKKIIKLVEGGLLKSVSVIVANGKDTAEYIKQFYGRKSIVIPNAISEQRFSSSRNEHISDYLNAQVRSGKYIYLHVGTLRPIKGIDYILQAYSNLPTDIKSNSCLVFVGKGQIESYRTISEQLGIHTLFEGEKKDLSEYYKIASVVINVSGGSGVSNSLIESLYYSKPVICWDKLTFSQVVTPETGFLCKEKDINALAMGMENAYFQSEAMSLDKIKESVEQFTWEHLWPKWQDVIGKSHQN